MIMFIRCLSGSMYLSLSQNWKFSLEGTCYQKMKMTSIRWLWCILIGNKLKISAVYITIILKYAALFVGGSYVTSIFIFDSSFFYYLYSRLFGKPAETALYFSDAWNSFLFYIYSYQFGVIYWRYSWCIL